MAGNFFRRLAALLVIPFFMTTAFADTDPCTELSGILDSSKTDFREHRSGAKYFNRVTIWNTDLSLAGLESQVWQWGKGNYSFVGTRAFPMEQAGNDFLKQSTDSLKTCLKTEIDITENASPVKDGVHTRVRAKSDNRRIDLFLVRNGGLFRDSWTFYFMATGANGYPLPSLQQGDTE